MRVRTWQKFHFWIIFLKYPRSVSSKLESELNWAFSFHPSHYYYPSLSLFFSLSLSAWMFWWRRICYSWRALSSEFLILYSFVYRLLHPSGVWSRKTPRATSTILPFCPSPSPVCCQSIHPFLSWSVTLFHIVLSICLCLSLLQLFNSFSPIFLFLFLHLFCHSSPLLSQLSLNCNSGWCTTLIQQMPD